MEQTNSFIAFHILDCGISKITQSALQQYVALYPKASIHFHTIPIEDLQHFPTPAYYSIATYARFYVAELVPDIDKALYMDVDMCVSGNIVDIFNRNLEKYGLGAVSADSDNVYLSPALWLHEHKKMLEMKRDDYYFCAGLLLINCAYWREHKIKQKALELMNNITYELPCPDQDILNILFRGNYKILSPHLQYFASESLHQYDTSIQQYMKKSQSLVIHYTSKRKPWNSSQEEIRFSELWWKYAKLTPFYRDFSLELIHIKLQHLKEVAQGIYRKSLYTRITTYLKYKTSFGKKESITKNNIL